MDGRHLLHLGRKHCTVRVKRSEYLNGKALKKFWSKILTVHISLQFLQNSSFYIGKRVRAGWRRRISRRGELEPGRERAAGKRALASSAAPRPHLHLISSIFLNLPTLRSEEKPMEKEAVVEDPAAKFKLRLGRAQWFSESSVD